MEMEDYREQETITNLKKALKIQEENISILLDVINVYACRDEDNEYYSETFSIPCYNPEDFTIFNYRNDVRHKNISDLIIEMLKILAKNKEKDKKKGDVKK